MHQIVFSSVLSESYYRDLQDVLFLNGNQSKVVDDIVENIERYGEPSIKKIDNKLRIALKSETLTQTLFVLNHRRANPELLGTVVYTRESDSLVILYVAVREDYCSNGDKQDELLFLRIVSQVRSIGRRIKGVSTIRIFEHGKNAGNKHVSLSVARGALRRPTHDAFAQSERRARSHRTAHPSRVPCTTAASRDTIAAT